jgi:N-acetylmuramic acid 6-phosphate etherase
MYNDVKKVRDIISEINNNDKQVAQILETKINDVDKAILKIYEKYKNGGRIIYVAAGTSGRIALLDAMDMSTTFGVEDDRFITLMAGGNDALYISKDGEEDRTEIAEEYLRKIKLNSRDVVIGLSASGRTPYVRSAIAYANSIDCLTIIIANKLNCEISNIAKTSIEVDLGEEFISGSSRMKAATCQKLILNMISTTLMILDGNVYRNMMVNVKPKNQKIYNRCVEMIVEITKCTRDVAEQSFEKSSNVKVSCVSIIKKISIEKSKELLSHEKNLEEILKNE